MKNKFLALSDKLLLRKRALIETVNDQLKNISQIEHTRHRSLWNFVGKVAAGLIAYTWREKKPSLNIQVKEQFLISNYVIRYLLMKTPLKPLLSWTPAGLTERAITSKNFNTTLKIFTSYPLLSIINQWRVFRLPGIRLKMACHGRDGNQAKLWDVGEGSLITENPLWDTSASDGTTAYYEGTLSWSPDGVMFISVDNSYDGQTGEYLTLNLLKHSSTYSNQEYGYLRGGSESINHNIASPYSATSDLRSVAT